MHSTRIEQLESLYTVHIDNIPLIIHGSVGYAAMMGLPLPPETNQQGVLRDIDVYVPGVSKDDVEIHLSELGNDTPNLVDATLSDMLKPGDESQYVFEKRGVSGVLRDAGVFGKFQEYDLVDIPGLKVRSFVPEAAFALHTITRPRTGQAHHRILSTWFEHEGIALSAPLEQSLNEFRKSYATTRSTGSQ